MKKLTLLLLVALMLIPAGSMAQDNKRSNRAERKEWMKKLKALKHDFLAKELDLTENQKAEFFDIYDSKEAERMDAEQKVKQAEHNVRHKGEAASDADYDAAIRAQYNFNSEIASIESKYEALLRKVLTKRQLYKLRGSEHAFQRKLMEQCPPPHKNSHNNKKKTE